MGESRVCVIRSVLVVDDDEATLGACERSLRKENVTVFLASSPVRARYLVRTEKPDLCVIDLRLGTSSGIDLISQIKSDGVVTKVALVSGWLSLSTALAAIRAGADIFLSKPYSPKQIIHYIETDTVPEPELDQTPSLERVEYEHIQRVLEDSDGNVSEAARRLGIYRQSLARKLKKPVPRL